MKKQFILHLIALGALLSTGHTVYATTEPTFQTCVNVQAPLKVKYDTGLHGIIGRDGLVSGSDAVYSLENGNFMQCFCPDNGNGVQTNWWKISGLSPEEIESYKAQGWFHEVAGENWGLPDGEYLAKNSDYACRSTSSGGSSNTSTFGTSTVQTVLALASTGNIVFIISLFLLGIASFVTGLLLRARKA